MIISPYAKHLGPGDHPSGSPQTVHGRGGGSRYVIQHVTSGEHGAFMVLDTQTGKYQSTHSTRERAKAAVERRSTFFGRPVSEGPSTGVSPSRVLSDFASDPNNEWIAPDHRRYYVKRVGEQNIEEIWVEYELNGAKMDARAFTHDGPDGSWYKHSLHGIRESQGSGRVTNQPRQMSELVQGMGIDPAHLGLTPPPPPVDTSDWLDPRTRESIDRTIAHNESRLESLYHDLDTEKELAGVYSGTLDPIETDDVVEVQNRIRELEAETTRLRVLQNNPPLPGMDPPLPERMTGEKKPITSATGKVTATFEDPYSLSDRAHESGNYVSDWTPEDIFEGTVELNDGSRFTAQVEDTGYSNDQAVGFIYNEDGDRIGKFDRQLHGDGEVYNSSFTINPEYRGQGIGTLFLAHWEEELAAAGFERMRLQTADVGNYAWAVSGYEWDSGAEGYFDLMKDMVREDEEYSEEGESDLADLWGQDAVDELRSMVEEIEEGYYYPEPYEIASIGSRNPHSSRGHLGKLIMLDGPGWYGIKYLDHYNFQKALSYSILYNEWARRDPAAIENDAPEWWAAVRQLLSKDQPTVEKIYSPYAKHYGDGPHPGTGTPQSVHGGGGGGRRRPVTPKDVGTGNPYADHPLFDPEKGAGEILGDLAQSTNKTTWGELTFTGSKDGRRLYITDEHGLGGTALFERNNMGGGTYSWFLAGDRFIEDDLDGQSLVDAFYEEYPDWGGGLRGSGKMGDKLIPLPEVDEFADFEDYLPEEMPLTQVDDVAKSHLTYEGFVATDTAMFGGKEATQGYNQPLASRTQGGLANIATYMEHFDNGGQIRGDFREARSRLTPNPTEFMDNYWEEMVGEPSQDGYNPETGSPTWLEPLLPSDIEGQVVVPGFEDVVNPSHAGPYTWAPSEVDTLQYDPGLLPDPKDPAVLNDFIEDWSESGYGFEDAIKAAGGTLPYTGAALDSWREAQMMEGGWIGDGTASEGPSLIPDFLATVTDNNGELDMDNAASYFREKWASSASHPVSVAIQMSAERQFDIVADTDHWEYNLKRHGAAFYDEFGTLVDAYTQSVYINTQEGFRQAGITHIPVVRGMSLTPEDFNMPDLETTRGGWVTDSAIASIPVGEWVKGDMDLQPLSSFSTHPDISLNFVSDRRSDISRDFQVMTRTLVPVERVWGHALDNLGALTEHEVLVIGGRDLPMEWLAARYPEMDNDHSPRSLDGLVSDWSIGALESE